MISSDSIIPVAVCKQVNDDVEFDKLTIVSATLYDDAIILSEL